MLRETIQSVLIQDYQNFTVIISNDNPLRVIDCESLGVRKDPRVIYVNQPKNLGEIDNMNWLMDQAKGELFTWLADDDLIHPLHISNLVENLMRCPRSICAYSSFTSDFESFKTSKELEINEYEVSSLGTAEFNVKYSKREITLIGCYGLFRVDAIRKIGGVQRLAEGFSPYADTLIPVLLSTYGEISYYSAPTLFFRSHPNSMSNGIGDWNVYLQAENAYIDIVQSILENLGAKEVDGVLKNYGIWFTENHYDVSMRDRGASFTAQIRTFMRLEKALDCKLSRSKLQQAEIFLIAILRILKNKISIRLNR